MFMHSDYGYSLNRRLANPRATSGGLLLVPGGPMTPEKEFIAILGGGGVFTIFLGFV